jgi:hypothetical protein
VLPSDCRHRQDLAVLREGGELQIAQEWKVQLEEQQRRDAALREQGRREEGLA